MKDELTTGHLDRILSNVSGEKETNTFIDSYAEDQYSTFSDYINAYIQSHDLDTAEIIRNSRISTNYVYNILNGVTKSPGRDKILALCIAAGMTKKEADRALTLADKSRLYSKNERDIRIIVCLNEGIRDVTLVNLRLEKYGLPLIEA